MADTCRKCGGEMQPSKAIGQTIVSRRPARGPDDCRTFYAGGTGRLIDCLKCVKCGWSVTPPEPVKTFAAIHEQTQAEARDILRGEK